jgi:hypothetical protein
MHAHVQLNGKGVENYYKDKLVVEAVLDVLSQGLNSWEQAEKIKQAVEAIMPERLNSVKGKRKPKTVARPCTDPDL